MKNWKTGLNRQWEKYKYFIAVIAVGVLLLVSAGIPNGKSGAADADEADSQEFDLASFQRSVSESLSKIDGAGNVEVLLSLESGEESVYASDISQTSQTSGGNTDSSSESYQSTMSILSDGSYGESPVLIKSNYPTFRGAVILCDGADNDVVRLQITQAVSALCGISTDHISISKMSQ